ncbi:MAG: hypothetical protein ACLQM6_07035 [Acidobacteriaceae bacterium]
MTEQVMNCWENHPTLCQSLHWWHWLAYGQNAAVVGLIGLVFYVIYTRRMMYAAEQTRRATLIPTLALVGIPNLQPQDRLIIVNVGGVALNAKFWLTLVTPRFALGNWLLAATPEAHVQFLGSLVKGEDPTGILVEQTEIGSTLLCVIEFTDLFKGRGQLQILRTKTDTDRFEVEVNHFQYDSLAPAWKRGLLWLRSWWAVRRNEKARHAKIP